MKKTLLVLFLLIAFRTNAATEPLHKGVLSSISLGARYSSVLETRGVTLYNDFQIDPAIGVFLFDDKVEIYPNSISFRDYIYEDKIRFRTRLQQMSDNPFFPAYPSVKDGYVDRIDSYEWVVGAEFFFPSYDSPYAAELDISYAKDLKEHFGNYLNVLGKVKVGEFKMFHYRIEPNVFGSIGWGDSAHNQYMYGPSASQDGFNNSNIGLWFSFPDDADRYYPIILISRYSVEGSQNRNAEYARGGETKVIFYRS